MELKPFKELRRQALLHTWCYLMFCSRTLCTLPHCLGVTVQGMDRHVMSLSAPMKVCSYQAFVRHSMMCGVWNIQYNRKYV